jgi:pyruvate/2-oxoglutarate dehydrogenase complex dihydrolipoamide acyltransferase (E2) component
VTVTVTRQDVTSVVVESGSVVPYPGFVISSTTAGVVRVNVRPGDRLAQGQSIATVDGKSIAVPGPGTVTAVLAPAGGSDLPANAPLVTVRYAGFGIPVSVSAENLYRVYRSPIAALASLTSGASGVPCRVVPAADGTTTGNGAATEGGPKQSPGLEVVCLLAGDVQAFTGQPAKVGIRFATVPGALTLPVSAVTGSAQTGTVTYVAADGARSGRTVTLGVTDGVVVQIVSGLSAGDRVAAQPPDFTGP